MPACFEAKNTSFWILLPYLLREDSERQSRCTCAMMTDEQWSFLKVCWQTQIDMIVRIQIFGLMMQVELLIEVIGPMARRRNVLAR